MNSFSANNSAKSSINYKPNKLVRLFKGGKAFGSGSKYSIKLSKNCFYNYVIFFFILLVLFEKQEGATSMLVKIFDFKRTDFNKPRKGHAQGKQKKYIW